MPSSRRGSRWRRLQVLLFDASVRGSIGRQRSVVASSRRPGLRCFRGDGRTRVWVEREPAVSLAQAVSGWGSASYGGRSGCPADVAGDCVRRGPVRSARAVPASVQEVAGCERSEPVSLGSIELTVAKAKVRIAGVVDAVAFRVVLECLIGCSLLLRTHGSGLRLECIRPGKHTVDEGCMPRLGYLLSLAA
jgi:hypothetical protein